MEKIRKHSNDIKEVLNGLFVMFVILSCIQLYFGIRAAVCPSYDLLGSWIINDGNVEISTVFVTKCFLSALKFGLACIMTKLLLKIAEPIIMGRPFVETVYQGLRIISFYVIAVGVLNEAEDILGMAMSMRVYKLKQLFDVNFIVEFDYKYVLDGTFLIIAVILYVLSIVFKYGAELQTQVDETL